MGAGEDGPVLFTAGQPAKKVAHSIPVHLQTGSAHPLGQLLARLHPGGAVHRTHDATLRLPADGAQGLYVPGQQ